MDLSYLAAENLSSSNFLCGSKPQVLPLPAALKSTQTAVTYNKIR